MAATGNTAFLLHEVKVFPLIIKAPGPSRYALGVSSFLSLEELTIEFPFITTVNNSTSSRFSKTFCGSVSLHLYFMASESLKINHFTWSRFFISRDDQLPQTSGPKYPDHF